MHIRNEEPRDHEAVEALTRRAFYNLYVPGCVEHYLVHIMRAHEDFIPELDFVLEEDELQRRGYGKALLEHSNARAAELGYDAVVIFGSPANYVSRGFQSCKKFQVSAEGGRYPAAMLVKELIPGALSGRRWTYYDSPVMAISEEEALRYDDTLPPMERCRRPSQEEFYILSHSFVE